MNGAVANLPNDRKVLFLGRNLQETEVGFA